MLAEKSFCWGCPCKTVGCGFIANVEAWEKQGHSKWLGWSRPQDSNIQKGHEKDVSFFQTKSRQISSENWLRKSAIKTDFPFPWMSGHKSKKPKVHRPEFAPEWCHSTITWHGENQGINDSREWSWSCKEAIGRFWIDPAGSYCWHGNRWCFSNGQTEKLSAIILQICHPHGLHLPVCDVLYKKRHNEEDTNEAAEAHEYDICESSDDDEPWQVTLPDDCNADFVDTVSDTISQVLFHNFFPMALLMRVLKILNMTSLRSLLWRSPKQKSSMTFYASQKIIWIAFKKMFWHTSKQKWHFRKQQRNVPKSWRAWSLV